MLTVENLGASTNNSTFNFAKMSACAPSSEPTHARVEEGVRERVRETGRQLERRRGGEMIYHRPSFSTQKIPKGERGRGT